MPIRTERRDQVARQGPQIGPRQAIRFLKLTLCWTWNQRRTIRAFNLDYLLGVTACFRAEYGQENNL